MEKITLTQEEYTQEQCNKAKILEMFLNSSLKWYERPVVSIVLVISSLLPLSASMFLFRCPGRVLAQNPKLRMAKELTKLHSEVLEKGK